MANFNGPLDLPMFASPPREERHRVKRSLTESTSPSRLRRRHHDHPHRGLHHHHHQQHHRHFRHDNDEPAVSGVYPPPITRHSADMARPEAIAPAWSPDQSRRASVLISMDDDARFETKESRAARLRLEKEKAALRAENLKRSLAELNGFSTNMTKRLDDTYYAVLEKMSTLQNTVTALKDLAESSREICDGFDKDSRELADDIVGQLVAVGQFDEQQTRIAGLQNRISEGRAKVQTLTGRVDVIRERIESWERADKAWQERTRKRLKIIWSVTSVVAILIIALAIGVHYSSARLDSTDQDELRNTAAAEWLSESNYSRQSSESGESGGRALFWKTPLRDGERLRAFDEL